MNDNITVVPTTDDMIEQARRALESSDRDLEETMLDAVHRAAVEGDALGDAEKVKDEERAEFWALHNRVNATSAVTPTYTESCKMLNLDPMKPTISYYPTNPGEEKTYWLLKPHQVTALAWFVIMTRKVGENKVKRYCRGKRTRIRESVNKASRNQIR